MLIAAVLKSLCAILGHDPRTVSVAASIISKDRQLNARQYLRELEESQPSRDLPLEERELFRPMKLAFSKLRPQTQIFLRVCAHLDRRNIWSDMLDHIEECELSTHLWSQSGALNMAIRDLENFSLLEADNKMSSGTPRHVLHPAMYRYIRHSNLQQDKDMQQLFFSVAVFVIGRSVPEKQFPGYHEHIRRLQGHVEGCYVDFINLGHRVFSWCRASLARLAIVLDRLGDTEKATRLLGMTINLFAPADQLSEFEELQRIDMVNSQGVFLLDQRRFQAARDCFETVIASQSWSRAKQGGQQPINPILDHQIG